MRLEVGSFPVNDVAFGSQTRLQDGSLEIDRDELESLALQGGKIPWASIDIVRPGDSVRLINSSDSLVVQTKVDGPGVVYPGVCGRPTTTVGKGRTHRLGNMALMVCVDSWNLTPGERAWPQRVEQAQRHGDARYTPTRRRLQGYIDMSGPGNKPPYDALSLVCVTLEAPKGEGEERLLALRSAALAVADRLAQVTVGLEPPELESFDFTSNDPSLPNFVFIPNLASIETHAGARSAAGVSIYGQTRLSAPWSLYPTEVMDGAVFGSRTWQIANNPIVMELARRHGKTCNFLGCIIQRTNWTEQPEKEMVASRAALLAKQLGADGAIVTADARGQRYLDTALTVQACEREGIKTVLLTEEEDNEGGTAPPLLVAFPEIQSVVSAGTGGGGVDDGVDLPFPAVDKVVGAREVDESWLEERPPIHGSYGSNYLQDYYGFGRQSLEDY